MCLCALSSIIKLLCLRESFLHIFYVFRNRFWYFIFCELYFIKMELNQIIPNVLLIEEADVIIKIHSVTNSDGVLETGLGSRDCLETHF